MVPVYNEALRLGRHFDDLVSFLRSRGGVAELVVVDDGSSDGTREVAESLASCATGVDVRVIARPHRGKGAAVQAGVEAARGDVIGFCDIDLSTSLDDLGRIFDAAERADLLAIGSRGLPDSDLTQRESRARELLGKAFNRAVQFTVTPGIVDTQCGAKAARRGVWEAVLPSCEEPGFAWDVEVIAVAASVGIPTSEIAVRWSFDEGSRVRVLRDGFDMVRALRRISKRNRTRARAMSRVPIEAASTTGAPGSFDDDNAALLAASDTQHWWFRSRAAYVTRALSGHGTPPGRLVDLGGGSGGVTAMLGRSPQQITIVEGNERLALLARRRHGFDVVRGEVGGAPIRNGCASVVCLLDVIEHLIDPVAALAEARRLLAPNGRVVLMVPAHPRLWSAADDALGHQRRYTRNALRSECTRAGLDVLHCTHVFSWLVAPVWLTRRRNAGRAEPGLDRTSPLIDRAALVLTAVEKVVAARASLPFGTSILCVAARAEEVGHADG